MNTPSNLKASKVDKASRKQLDHINKSQNELGRMGHGPRGRDLERVVKLG